MADQTQAPTSAAALLRQRAGARVVANPAPSQAAPAVAVQTTPTVTLAQVVITLCEELSNIAIAEGSQAKPSAKAWGQAKRRIDAILDDLGVRVAPPPTAALKLPATTSQNPPQGQRMQMRTPYNQRQNKPADRSVIPSVRRK
jgi:hypothetical protein